MHPEINKNQPKLFKIYSSQRMEANTYSDELNTNVTFSSKKDAINQPMIKYL
uniref:Uncharacterized protein n=1 Tax=Marseillevirus LCMAC102 TaxID=2506603 RepID=A0A481YT88_9VIRU|nr:MAG: hypothetical protein LCMAC102_00040 [Marseillevirus LCMAC102]